MSEAWHWRSIGEIGAAFGDGRLTPSTYLDHLLARIDLLEPTLHAFIALDRKGAKAAARAADARIATGKGLGPLDGIPIGIKDLIDVEGFATTCHSTLRRDHRAGSDAIVVAKLRAAGAIILGKLSTHEFAIGGPAFDLPFPPARNPWNPDHHPGGSSSGAGAGVAGGLFPAALGTDTAGSVRNPASACGIVGIKPTYDLVSREGVFPLAWTLDHVGPLTRSVMDAALMLDVMADGEPTTPYSSDIGKGVQELRIGLVRHFHESDMQADAETVAAIEGVAAALATRGAIISDIALPPLYLFAMVNRVLLQSEGFVIHGAAMRARPQDFSASTRTALLPGAFLAAEDGVTAMRHRRLLTDAVDRAFAQVDILLCASSMEPACRIEDAKEIARTYMLQARSPFNVTGHPALAMMAGLSSNGLPISVQFAARRHEERGLFRVAATWEQVHGGGHASI